MTISNSDDPGLWKGGKGIAFTHIPTNFLLFFEISSFKNHTDKVGEQDFDLKKFNKRVLEVFPKKLLAVGDRN